MDEKTLCDLLFRASENIASEDTNTSALAEGVFGLGAHVMRLQQRVEGLEHGARCREKYLKRVRRRETRSEYEFINYERFVVSWYDNRQRGKGFTSLSLALDFYEGKLSENHKGHINLYVVDGPDRRLVRHDFAE